MGELAVPQLRVAGFDGEWEELTLGDVSRRINSKNADGATKETFTNSAQYGIISQLDYFDNSVSNPENIGGYYVVEPNDFVYNPRISTSAPYGPVNRNKLGRRGATSPLYSVFRPSGIDYSFLEYFFKTDYWHDFMRMNGDTGARHDRFSIGVEDFYRLNLSRPSDEEEQQAIGSIFTQFDRLIGQHRRKYEQLQQTKIALMQRMFPQGDAEEPELRCKGFEGAWGCQRLGEFEIKTGPFGSALHASAYVLDGTPIVTTEHFKTGWLPVNGAGIPQVSDTDALRLSAYRLQKGDIVFSRVGSVDLNAFVTADQVGWLFSGRVLRVRPDGACDPAYLHYALETDPVRQSILSRAVGQTMPSINTKILSDTTVPMPKSGAEQLAIAATFTKLDELISAERRYITKLQQVKSGLLQKMFI